MSAQNKTHDALVADWQANAKKHDEENYWFLRSLKQWSGKKVDRIALELHQEAFSIMDCTKCANCCRTLRPIFTEEDIARIAGHLGMARDEFIAAYLERDEEQGRYRTKTTPCPFLGEDKRCTIYEVKAGEMPRISVYGQGRLRPQHNEPRQQCGCLPSRVLPCRADEETDGPVIQFLAPNPRSALAPLPTEP